MTTTMTITVSTTDEQRAAERVATKLDVSTDVRWGEEWERGVDCDDAILAARVYASIFGDPGSNLSDIITADADERIRVRSSRRGEVIVAVLPDEDEDDCLEEARALVERLYGEHQGVSSVTCEGWEGGADGERCFVSVRIGGRVH